VLFLILISWVSFSSSSYKDVQVYEKNVYLHDFLENVESDKDVFLGSSPFPGQYKYFSEEMILKKTNILKNSTGSYRVYRPYRTVTPEEVLKKIDHLIRKNLKNKSYVYVLKGENVRLVDIDFDVHVENLNQWGLGSHTLILKIFQKDIFSLKKAYTLLMNAENKEAIIPRGKTVTVVFKKGLVKLTAPGVNLENVLVDQETSVRISMNQRILKGVATSENEVEVVW
jgi:hypothetical protein